VYRRIVLGLCVLAAMSGCTVDVESPPDSSSEPVTASGPPTIDLDVHGANLTGAQLCELVPKALVADLFPGVVARTTSEDDNQVVAPHRKVDGLGDAAGFGRDPVHNGAFLLEVGDDYDDGHRRLTVHVDAGNTTLDQLRRIANRVLDELDG
jgi:hypothetical protein